ncbi:MAG TPA: hypothetical protein VEW46_04440 [Pyrinomonadaceae bacterium]|nr:hypothetical protein [Pyrinomonadaceae bacterium]
MKNRPENSGSETVSETSTNEALYRRFGEANMSLGRAQQEAQAANQKRSEEAYRNLFNTLQATTDDIQKRFQESYVNYMKALNEAWLQKGPQQEIEEIYKNYREAGDRLAEEAQQRYKEVYANYVKEMQSANDDVQRLVMDGYRKYLNLQKEIWTQMDINAFVDAAASYGS